MGDRIGFRFSGFGSGVACMAAALLLTIGGAAAAQEYHDCVVILLDASGSMAAPMGANQPQKIQGAKMALKQVLTKLPESTYFALLVFSGKNVPDKWLYPLGPRNDAELMKKIDLPQPGGNTPLGEFIKIGSDRLLEERAKQFGYGSYRLLVVTDGEATDGKLTEMYTPEVIARGITVDVIGVNMKQDHTLATQVHSYRRADDPKALTQALSEILGEVSASGTDAITQEAFDLLAPIPPELATAMVEALAHANNQPIGTKPPVQQPAARPKGPAAKSQPAAPGSSSKKNSPSWFVPAIVVVVILLVVRNIRRRR